MTIKTLYPTIRPTLDLNFAATRELDPLITFTRASAATYVGDDGLIKSAGVNEARFDHSPTTGESLGLLVEEQRTNLLLRSEEFDNASWTRSNITISSNSVSAPNGTVTADTLTDSNDGAAAAHSVITPVQSFISGLAYTISVYAQAGSLAGIAFIFPSAAFTSNLNARFNISTGTIQNLDSGLTGSITAVGGGWYRCSATATATATASNTIQIRTATASSSFYQGNGTGTIFLWGAQLEAGAFPTSYIPTTTATVTRSADVASISGSSFSSWYRQDEGTVFAECAITQPNSGGNQFVFRASDNGYNNSIAWNVQSSGFASIATAANGVFDGVASSISSLNANTLSKFAAGYQANNLAISLSGATPVVDTTATMPTALNRADIGADHAGFNRVRLGAIRRLTYWPQRLSNATLQALTR